MSSHRNDAGMPRKIPPEQEVPRKIVSTLSRDPDTVEEEPERTESESVEVETVQAEKTKQETVSGEEPVEDLSDTKTEETDFRLTTGLLTLATRASALSLRVKEEERVSSEARYQQMLDNQEKAQLQKENDRLNARIHHLEQLLSIYRFNLLHVDGSNAGELRAFFANRRDATTQYYRACLNSTHHSPVLAQLPVSTDSSQHASAAVPPASISATVPPDSISAVVITANSERVSAAVHPHKQS